MSDLKYGCIDAGAENCPCYLAETGDCIYCSRLAGKDYCDCDWKGVCVFNEFHQNGEKIQAGREEFTARIVSKKQYMEDLCVLALDTGRGFAIKAVTPGSFVSVKKPECSGWYGMPVSVMDCDTAKGHIHIAVKKISVKSKMIFEETECLLVRGIFRNGIIGIENAAKAEGSVAVISKGTGFAAAAHFVNSYPGCDIYIDTDKICQELVRDYMPRNFRGRLRYTDLNREKHSMVRELENYSSAVIATSEYFEKFFEANCSGKLQLALLNNYSICCGEGICGACCDKNGNKMCKCCGIQEGSESGQSLKTQA